MVWVFFFPIKLLLASNIVFMTKIFTPVGQF